MKDKNGQNKEQRETTTLSEKHYKSILRRQIFRLTITYLAPLVILMVYFNIQYGRLLSESNGMHLRSVAEHQSKVIDLFLRERIVNLLNIIDDPSLEIPPSKETMRKLLKILYNDSETFIDIGFFDSSGVQLTYAGPLPVLEKKDYGNEKWFRELKASEERYIITDIYSGFRQKPHFTIAVRRYIDRELIIVRATLDPKKLYDFIITLENARDVHIGIVNAEGHYQLASAHMGKVLERSEFSPPHDKEIGISETEIDGNEIKYAYSWFTSGEWAVIVRNAGKSPESRVWGLQNEFTIVSLILILITFTTIILRSKRIVKSEREKDIVRTQLVQASKLASVGELASGIAHEINNPLAIISGETGLMYDYVNPEFSSGKTIEDIKPHLKNINEAVFRCRDITRKLLSFVRQSDFELRKHNINALINELIEGFYAKELEVENIKIMQKLDENIPEIQTNANQLKQVILNLMNNAVDAIQPPGKITVVTKLKTDIVVIEVTDTGVGISEEQMERIFMPFYTTKEVGKGTGLGLSVSLGIIKSLGGEIHCESIPGKGTSFFVELPLSYEEA